MITYYAHTYISMMNHAKKWPHDLSTNSEQSKVWFTQHQVITVVMKSNCVKLGEIVERIGV